MKYYSFGKILNIPIPLFFAVSHIRLQINTYLLFYLIICLCELQQPGEDIDADLHF